MTKLPPDFTRRLGTVRISSFMINAQPEAVIATFARAIVLRCEHRYVNDSFEYTMIHPAFDPVEPGSLPPEYMAVTTCLEPLTFEWARVGR